MILVPISAPSPEVGEKMNEVGSGAAASSCSYVP